MHNVLFTITFYPLYRTASECGALCRILTTCTFYILNATTCNVYTGNDVLGASTEGNEVYLSFGIDPCETDRIESVFMSYKMK